MIEGDRLIICGLRDVDRCYTQIMHVLATTDIRTNDPIGTALTPAEQEGLAFTLNVLSNALAERAQCAHPVVEGDIELGNSIHLSGSQRALDFRAGQRAPFHQGIPYRERT